MVLSVSVAGGGYSLYRPMPMAQRLAGWEMLPAVLLVLRLCWVHLVCSGLSTVLVHQQ